MWVLACMIKLFLDVIYFVALKYYMFVTVNCPSLPEWSTPGASLQGSFMASPTNVRLDWKGQLETNTLAYDKHS